MSLGGIHQYRKLGSIILILALMLTLLWPVQFAIEADSSNLPMVRQALKDALVAATKSAALQFDEEALHRGIFLIDQTKALEAFRVIMENNLKVDSEWVPVEGSIIPSPLHVRIYLYNDRKEKTFPGTGDTFLMEDGDTKVPLTVPSITVKKPTILAVASFIYTGFWGKKVVVEEYASAQVNESVNQKELMLPQIKISFFTDKNGHYQVPANVQNLGDGLFLASANYTVRTGESRIRALDIIVPDWGQANYMDIKLGGENTLPIQESDLSDLRVYNGTDGDQFLVVRQPDDFYRAPKMGKSETNVEIVMQKWYPVQAGNRITESFLFRMGENFSTGVQFGSIQTVRQDNTIPSYKTGTISGGSGGGAGTTYTFNYTGSVQTWKVPYTGRYKLEVWGADGGYQGQGPRNNGDRPLGGYIAGEVTLNANEILYIYVGGNGLHGGWNGGGSGWNGGESGLTYVTTGGGATDIRRNGDTLNHRIIAAGGGGGRSVMGNNYGLEGEGGYGGGGDGYYFPQDSRTPKREQAENGASPTTGYALGQGEPSDGKGGGGGGGWYGGWKGLKHSFDNGASGGGGGSNGYDPSQVQLLESVGGSNKGVVAWSYSLDGIAKITALTDPLNVNWDTNNTFPTPFTKGETKSVTLRLSNPSNGVTWNPTNTSIKVEWRRASDNLLIQAPTYPVSTTVNQGEMLTQTLDIQAPSVTGTYNVVYKLVNGVEAESTQTFSGIEVREPSFKVDWDGMNTFPSVLLQGGSNSVSVKMTNPTGTTWAPSNVKINLEWRRKTDNVLMYTLSVPISASVSPGGSHQQTITFATPNLPVGNYLVIYNLINTALGMGGDKVQSFDVSINPANKIEGISLVDVARSPVPIQLPQPLPGTKPLPIRTGYNLTLHVTSRGTGTMRLELFSGGQTIPIGKDSETLSVLEFPILDGGGYITFFVPTTVKKGTIIDVKLTEITHGAGGDISTVYLANRSFEVYGVAYQDVLINRTN